MKMIKFIAVMCVMFFVSGCAVSSTQTLTETEPATQYSTDSTLTLSEKEKSEVESKSKKSGFRCLIDKIASGIS